MAIIERFRKVQGFLIPDLEKLSGALSKQHQLLVHVLDATELHQHVAHPETGLVGRPSHSRLKIFRAFIGRCIWNYSQTRAFYELLKQDHVLRKLCGWELPSELPSESTFSRAFKEFSELQLPEVIRQSLVRAYYEDRIIGHVSRDSSDVPVREKAVLKTKEAAPKYRVGRPKKGEKRPPKQKRRLVRQLEMEVDEMLDELPSPCDIGAKKKGQKGMYNWKGYKLHADVSDEGIVLSQILSSASVHDSQCSIPLTRMTSEHFNYLYELMDSGYDMPEIKAASTKEGHVPIIDCNPRTNKKLRQQNEDNKKAEKALNWQYPEQVRYKIRTTVERTFSRLKDGFGVRTIYFRGSAKVACLLSFALLAHTVETLVRLHV